MNSEGEATQRACLFDKAETRRLFDSVCAVRATPGYRNAEK